MNKNDIAIIMAGGTGIHLKSGLPPVMAQVMGKSMISRVLTAVESSGTGTIIIIVPKNDTYIADCIKREFPKLEIHAIEQNEPLGTAHAVLQAYDYIKISALNNGNVIILNGDTPFMDANTICASYSNHIQCQNDVTVITALVSKPFGYGRIMRDSQRKFEGIIEEQDANSEIKKINEISSGTFWFKSKILIQSIEKLSPRPNGQYNLVDTVSTIIQNNGKADTFFASRSDIVLGANNRMQLMELNEYAKKQEIEYHLSLGVDIPFSDGVIIEPGVQIGIDTRILPNTIIKGNTKIGKNCIIGPNTLIEDSTIYDDVILNNVQCHKSIVKSNAEIGPYVEIPPNSVIVGNNSNDKIIDVKNN